MIKIEDLDKNMSILVVDDYSTVRRVVKNCLLKLGFKNISEAESGNSALEIAKDNKFDLIISDWDMPDMKAQDLIRKISQPKTTIPCLMVVSEIQKKQTLNVEPPDKSDFIIKPFTVETLEEKILKVLN